MGTHPIFESDFDCLTDLKEYMSYLPTIRPSMVRFTKENQLSRAELARRHEESLYAKFKLITKQTDNQNTDNQELPDLVDSEGSESNISHAHEPFMPEMEMTDQDFDTDEI